MREYLYHVFDRVLSSTLPLPNVPEAASEDVADIVFRVAKERPGGKGPLAEDHLRSQVQQRAGNIVRFYDLGTSFVLRWMGFHDFEVSRDGRFITCYPQSSGHEDAIRSCLYGSGLALALHLQGTPSFHASAISLCSGAVAFVASGGTGKSTLAAAHVREGYRSLTDDVLAVSLFDEGWWATPSFPWITLTRQSFSCLYPELSFPGTKARKARVLSPASSFCDRAVPLNSFYLLERHSGTDIGIAPVPQQDAVWKLLQHTCCLPFLEHSQVSTHFDFVCRLPASVPVYRLRYPSGLNLLSSVIDAVVENERSVPVAAETGRG